MPGLFRRLLIGRPLATKEATERRLGNFAGLAVFASDALSSVAYATEEILLVLVLAGPIAFHYTGPISLAIVGLLWILAVSYRQTLFAYPTGGGAFTVAKENLGVFPGVLAGSALLVDYVLTVAVSVAAGIAALTSAIPALYEWRVPLAVIAVLIVAIGNLRGVRESGSLFAPPAYGFMLGILVLVFVGLLKYISSPSGYGIAEAVETHARSSATIYPLTVLLILKAFSSGCAALTGVEAISNGVTAFKRPESQNAARVLRWLAMILTFLFLGISGLSKLYGIIPTERETVISQLAHAVFGSGFFYGYIQVVTCAILILAANTAFAGFPRLASQMAREGFLPRQLQSLGDRLVFSNGILLLAGFACALLVLFGAKTHALIPLYAVGVFLSFTLSQAGMVAHYIRLKQPEWKRGVSISLTGACVTTVVVSVILIAKFTHGAWIIALAIPLLIAGFYAIRDHYRQAARQLTALTPLPERTPKHTVIVPVAGLHQGVITALNYARSLSSNVRAVTVALDERPTKNLTEQWEKWAKDIPLVVLQSPYRSLIEPLIDYIKEVDAQDPDDLITVVIPSFVPARWWHHFLHNQSSILLNAALRNMRNVVITSVRFHFDR